MPFGYSDPTGGTSVWQCRNNAVVLCCMGGGSACEINADADASEVDIRFPAALHRGNAQHGHDGNEVEDDDADVGKSCRTEGGEALVRNEKLLEKCHVRSSINGESSVEDVFDVLTEASFGDRVFSLFQKHAAASSLEDEDALSSKSSVGFENARLGEALEIKGAALFSRGDACIHFCDGNAARREERLRSHLIIGEGDGFARIEWSDVEEVPGIQSEDAMVKNDTHSSWRWRKTSRKRKYSMSRRPVH